MQNSGIYILKLKDQFRVTYIPNSENLNWSFLSFDMEDHIIDTRLVEFYENAENIPDYKNAIWIALKMKKRCSAEIYTIHHNKTWKQVLGHAKYLAAKEIDEIQKQNDRRWDNEIFKLSHIERMGV